MGIVTIPKSINYEILDPNLLSINTDILSDSFVEYISLDGTNHTILPRDNYTIL